MGASKKKKKIGATGVRQGKVGSSDTAVAAYERLVSALDATGQPGAAQEAARTVRLMGIVLANPSGAACFLQVAFPTAFPAMYARCMMAPSHN